ncbi:hypothetical protein [Leucobacter sp. GX24907]
MGRVASGGVVGSKPKLLFANQAAFSKLQGELVPRADLSERLLREVPAAQLQHLVMYGMRYRATRDGMTGEEMAERIGIARDRYYRLMRGEVSLTLADFLLCVQVSDVSAKLAGQFLAVHGEVPVETFVTRERLTAAVARRVERTRDKEGR